MSLIACTETKLSSFPKEMYFYWILPPPFGSTFLKVLTTVSLHNKGNDLLPNPNPCWSSCMHLRNILPSAIQNVNSIYFLVMYGCCFVVYKAHSYIISYLGTQALIALEWKYFHNNLSAILWCLSYSYMNQWQVKYAELQLNEKSTLHCFEGHSHSASEAMISGCSSKKHQLCEVALSFRSISLTADSTQCGQWGWKHPCWPGWLHSALNWDWALGDFVGSTKLKQRLPHCVQMPNPILCQKGSWPEPMMGLMKHPTTLPLISNL